VVGHETVSVDTYSEPLARLLEQIEKHAAIIVDEEHILLVVPALSDVMGASRDDDPRRSRHGRRLQDGPGERQEMNRVR